MVYSYQDRSVDISIKQIITFSLKKISKLYPLHIITMISLILLVGVTNSSMRRAILLNTLLLQVWTPNAQQYFSLNGVSWYLSLCVYIYLAFPFIHKIIGKLSKRWHSVMLIILTFSLQIFISILTKKTLIPIPGSDNPSKWITYICPLFRLGDFFIGCNLGYLFLNSKNRMNQKSATFCELAVFFLIFLTQYCRKTTFIGGEWCRYSIIYLPTSVALIYLFAISNGLLSKLLTNRLMIYIGNMSPYAFLLHQVVNHYLAKYLAGSVIRSNQYLFYSLSLLVTLFLSQVYDNIIKPKVITQEADRVHIVNTLNN